MTPHSPHRARLAAVLASAALVATACGLLPGSDDDGGGDTTATAGSPDTTESSAARRCAEQTLQDMGRPERIGQLLMVGVPITQSRRAITWIERDHLGGVLLTGSVSTTVAPAAKAVGRLLDASPGDPTPYVAVTQEGGEVQTMTGDAYAPLPTAALQAKQEPQEIIDTVVETARPLNQTGINLTLSPVADTVMTESADDNAPIGALRRSFSFDPNDAATQVGLTVQAFQSQQVGAVLKHFPGMGRLTTDPADDPDAADDQLTAQDPQLVPFATGIESGARLVMLSPASYPELDDENPAVLSPSVVDLLRDQVGFDGVVMSYDLAGAATLDDVPVAERGAAFVRAGGDLALVEDPSQSSAVLDGMVDADRSSAEFADRVDESALRVLTAKAEQQVLSCD